MGLHVTVRRHGQVVMVHPRGSLTLHTATDLWRVLVKELLKGLGLSLAMLGNLTAAWGVDVASDGKTAWAVIAD